MWNVYAHLLAVEHSCALLAIQCTQSLELHAQVHLARYANAHMDMRVDMCVDM